MRCPDCNKFTSLETEITDQDIEQPEWDATKDADGRPTLSVTGTVHVARNCADCGNELKGADFEFEVSGISMTPGVVITQTEIDDGAIGAELEVDVTESGGGRYKKNLIGYTGTVTFTVTRTVDGKPAKIEIATATIEESISASSYEECC